MATISINEKPYEANDGQNLLAVCLSLGFNVPYFCWHPALGSVGACRQCAVKQFQDDKDTAGRLVMSCMTPPSDGTRISIDDPEAKAFRQSVIEWLMANHPHDCPVCDEGGECHLQDMTVLTGHAYRRFHFPKRTFRNQYLGPFIKHDMNRCIECYRCARFYRDYAGGRDFDVFASHNHVYFGRHEDGVLENEFSGNLIEVCPTGVFNDNTQLHHYTRKWDLQSAPSICTHCGVGCNTTPGERYGIIRRITNRYNSQVNGYFLCDRGRFGYEFVNARERIRHPSLKPERGAAAVRVSKDEALRHATVRINSDRMIGIGSPRASLEGNFALRTLVGPARFCTGLSRAEQRLLKTTVDIIRNSATPVASIADIEQADAVLVLGEDVLNTAPRMALALLQSIRQQPLALVDELGIPQWHDAAVREATHGRKGPLFIAGYHRTWLNDFATDTFNTTPDETARFGFAVAHELDPAAAPVSDLSGTTRAAARRVADALREAARPVVLSGIGSASEGVLHSTANVAWALHRLNAATRVAYAVPHPNSVGVALIDGLSLEDACEMVDADHTLMILENDVLRQSNKAISTILRCAADVVVLDHLESETTGHADVVFPASTFAEGDGTFVNYEGRAQRFYQVFVPQDEVQESWRWIREIAAAFGRPLPWQNVDDVVRALSREIPTFADLPSVAPPAGIRFLGAKIPRQPERYSGRTAIFAQQTLHEPKPPDDPDSPLAFSMEGYRGPVPLPLIPQFIAPGWHSNQALTKFLGEIPGPLSKEVSGVMLIRPHGNGRPYFTRVPAAFHRRAEQWLVLPIYHVFGSEELSARSPAVRERIPAPYLLLNAEDAKGHGLEEGRLATVSVNGWTYRLPIRISAPFPHGAAGVPILDTWERPPIPGWGNMSMVED
ncbi:NADH-quinone oxidoreductase subunit NuoG [Nitrospira sp. Nam74]